MGFMSQITRHEEFRTRTERPVTAREPAPPAALEYASAGPKHAARRGRYLRASVAVALIACGTFLAITPWWAASIALGREQPVSIFVNYFSSDFKWICIVLGAIMILAGTFGSAPHSEGE
jgi:hypothetical protein